jgi:release factor glutamine methyltransferase
LGAITDRASVESEALVGHVVGRGRIELFVEDISLTPAQARELERLVERRLNREPLQYVIGTAGFFGLELVVGPSCLVPRPETEVLVEAVLVRLGRNERVVDVGTGSGAIACAILKNRPDAEVMATEISEGAAAYARKNLVANGFDESVVAVGDLFEPLPDVLRGKIDVIVSNPPYLSTSEIAAAPPEVSGFEPLIATTAGPRGYEVSKRIIDQAPNWLKPGGWLFLETHPGQAGELKVMMKGFDEVRVRLDLGGRDRVIEGRKPL